MQTFHRPRPLRSAHLLARVGAIVLVSASLIGCGEDRAQSLIDDAARQLATINAGASGRQLSADRVYTQVRTALGNLPGSASESQKAAAALMLSQVERGLAEREAFAASERMGDAHRLLGPAEAELRAFELHKAAAASAAAFDPASLLADLRQRRAASENAEAQVRSRIEAARNRAKELNDRVSALRAQADEHRLRAAELQAQATERGPTAGLSQATAAHEARRAADAAALEAHALELEAQSASREADEYEIERQKFVEQAGALDQARNSVTQRQTSAQAEAATARQAAEQAAAALRDVLSGDEKLDALHSQIIPASFDAAVRGYEASIRQAQGARSTQRGSASLAIALANQALANLHATRAEGLLSYAALLESSARAGVPGAQTLADRGTQARQRASEHVRAAATAYDAAIENYQATGARSDAASIRDSLTGRLGELRAMVLDEQVSPESFSPIERVAPEAGDGAGGGAAPAASGDGEQSLRDAIRNLQQAVENMDGQAIVDFIHPAGPAEAQILGPISSMSIANMRLDQATEAAFGQRFTRWAAENPQALGPMGQMASSDMSASPLAEIDPDALDLRVSGNEGVAMMPDGTTTRFARVNGQWKQVLSMDDLGLPPEAAEGMAMMGIVARQFDTVVDRLITRIESGALQSNQAVAVEMVGAIMNAMRDAMGAGGPGGG